MLKVGVGTAIALTPMIRSCGNHMSNPKSHGVQAVEVQRSKPQRIKNGFGR